MSILRYENVNWSLPFLFNNQYFFVNLANAFKNLEIESPIKSVYGYIKNFWNGNEPGMERLVDIELCLHQIKEIGAVSIINMSNYHIEEADLEDRFCNMLLKYGMENGSQFCVSSDLLYNYIKDKYPEAKFVCSEIKSLYELEKGHEVEFYTNLYEKYEKIILSPHYVKNGFINDISKYNDLSKFEVIVNNNCLISCGKFKEHNESVEKFEMEKENYVDFKNFCPKFQMNLSEGVSNTLILNRDELDNIVNLGIKNLRLNGFCYQPALYPEMISSYVFNPIGNFQHVSFIIDKCIEIDENGITM